MPLRSHCVLAFASLSALAVVWPLPAQTVHAADSLLARGDTNGAIAAYESVIKRDGQAHDPEVHFRVGQLYMARYVPGTRLSADRRAAEKHFRWATRIEPDSAKYWLALAELFRSEDNVFTRIQVQPLIAKASQAAARHGGSGAALVHYRAGRTAWEQYEHYAHRYVGTNIGFHVAFPGPFERWRDVQQWATEDIRKVDDTGEAALVSAERNLRNALREDSASVDAAGLLVVLLGTQGRWSEALDVTRRLVADVPEDGRAWALRGLALARNNRWEEAQGAFAKGLPLMSKREREPYDDLKMVLSAAAQTAYEQQPSGRDEMDSLFWERHQPLAMLPTNQARTEFYARIAYVLHRWSDPLRGYRGHETDRGAVYVRYGPPDTWIVVNRQTVVWLYDGPKLHFVFDFTPGFSHARFAGDYREFYRESKDHVPVRFDDVRLVRGLDSIQTQVAEFRGGTADSNTTDVAVFSFVPLGRLMKQVAKLDVGLKTAAFVRQPDGTPVLRNQGEETIRGGTAEQTEQRFWRFALAPNEYRLRLEAYVPALERGARSVTPLAVRRFDDSTLQVSDVLLARRVTPRDSNYVRWSDFLIQPSAGRFPPKQPVGLLWEMYNLTPDSAGIVHYAVSVRFTVDSIERHTFLARVLGGLGDAVGVTAKGDDEVELTYRGASRLRANGIYPQYLSVGLEGAPAGHYTVRLVVTDQTAGRSVFAERPIVVTAEPPPRPGSMH